MDLLQNIKFMNGYIVQKARHHLYKHMYKAYKLPPSSCREAASQVAG